MRGPVRSAALIVSTIALGMITVGEGDGAILPGFCSRAVGSGVAYRGDKPTDTRDVAWCARENIIIFCPSPHVDKLAIRLSVKNILRRNGGASRGWDHAATQAAFWSNKSRARLYCRPVEVETIGKSCGSDLTFGKHSHVLSGGVSTILPLNSKMPIIFIGFFVKCPKLSNSCREDKSPLVSNQGLLGQRGLFPRDDNQNNREYSYCEGSDRTNGRVILVKESPGAIERNGVSLDERRTSIGRTFYLLLGCVICGLIAYTCLKGR